LLQDSAEGANKKQKNSNGGDQGENKEKEVKKDQKKGSEDPPTGYIHVRARRGQATDSHSLAERVQYIHHSLTTMNHCVYVYVCFNIRCHVSF